MEQLNSTTSEHKKGKHLTYKERNLIEVRLKDKWSPNRIAKEIGCAPNTVRNEIRRGTVDMYRGSVHRYKAEAGQEAYEANRKNSCRCYEFLKKLRFIKYVIECFRNQDWSLDVCAKRAVLFGGFKRSETVCAKTLYNYVDLGLIDSIKNIDLPVKVSRKNKAKRVRQNKRLLGRSIEERPNDILTRKEFGHWEIDLVLGSKSGKDDALLTLVERKTRNLVVKRIPDKTPGSVMSALKEYMDMFSEHEQEVFKTITTDNGSEFSQLSSLEELVGTLVYFAHPYTSCEKGSIERHNGLIRRFIPKGHRIDEYSNDDILAVELWSNGLPRKILGYFTPEEAFDAELDSIYAVKAVV